MQRLPDKERLAVYDAIFAYAFRHEESDLAYYLESILDNIRQTIDDNAGKQAAFLEKQRENGRKGGRPRKPTGFQEYQEVNSENPKNPTDSDLFFEKPKKANNKNKEQRIKTKNKEQEKKEDIDLLKSEISTSSGASPDDPQNPPYLVQVYQVVLSEFNARVEKTAIPQVKLLNDTRKAMVAARVKQYGLDAVLQTIGKAAASDFCNGNNKRGWRATFDWLFKPNNFAKTLDGNYDNRETDNGKDDRSRAERERDRRQREIAEYVQRTLNAPDTAEDFPCAVRNG